MDTNGHEWDFFKIRVISCKFVVLISSRLIFFLPTLLFRLFFQLDLALALYVVN